MARRKNTKRIDPRYFLNETTHRDLDEGLPRETLRNATEFANKIADIIRQQGGRMHAGDLLDHGVSGAEVNNFLGAIARVPNVGQLEQGAKVVLQGDRELAVVEPEQGIEEGGYFTTNMPDDIPTTAQLMKKMRGEPDEEPSPFSTTGPDPQAALTTDDLFKLFNAGMNPADLRDVNNSNLTPEMKSILGRPS